MSSRVETVVIVREDHPNRLVEINKSDLKPEDVLYEPSNRGGLPAGSSGQMGDNQLCGPETGRPVVQRPAKRRRK